MLFKNIIGQEEIKQQLTEMVQNNRLSHALLFLGKEGSGALPLALALAQFLVCEKVNQRNSQARNAAGPSLFGEDPITPAAQLMEACGTCPSCTKAQQLVHPDIHFSYPVIVKKAGTPPISTDWVTDWREFIKNYPYGNAYDWLQLIGAENKQGNITAHECNDIIHKLSLKSFESEYKILIMWMPEYLGNEGNKLLKLIEEPPANTLFILVAENESLILQTIISRCQLIKIPVLEPRDIEEALVSRHKTDPIIARQIAGVSDGNYREAMQLVQHADEDWQGLLKDWLNAILRNGVVAQTKWVDEISRLGREKQKQFLRFFNHILQQTIRLRVFGDSQIKPGGERMGLSIQEKDFVEKLNKRISDISQLEALVEELDRAVYYIERNANAKILFHALTIKVSHIIQDKIVFLAG